MKICSCCGSTLNTYTQTYPAKYNRPDRLMVTCENATCPTVGRTLNEVDHRELCESQSKSSS